MNHTPKLEDAQKSISISSKLILSNLAYAIPVIVLVYCMITPYNDSIKFSTWELKGNTYQDPLTTLMKDIGSHNFLVQTAFLNDSDHSDIKEKILALEKVIDTDLENLEAVNHLYKEDLQFTEVGLHERNRDHLRLDIFKTEWVELKNLSSNPDPKLLEKHAHLIADIRGMITHSGDISNLILDPDLDTYYLMDITLCTLPQMHERLINIISHTKEIITQNEVTKKDKIWLAIASSSLRTADLERFIADSQTIINEDKNFYGISPSLQENLPITTAETKKSIENLLKILDQMVNEPKLKVTLENFSSVADATFNQSINYWFSAVKELNQMLKTRVDTITEHRTRGLILSFLALLLACFLATFFSLTIKKLVLKSILDLVNELTHMNTNLEKLVDKRTATIRTILDNVKSGFFLLDRDQRVLEGFTKSSEILFEGRIKAGERIVDCLGLNERDAGNFTVQVDQVFEDLLEVNFSLSQIPSRFVIGKRILHFVGSAIRNSDEKIHAILFTVVDATELERAESESRTNKALVKLIQKKEAFRTFIHEFKTVVNLAKESINQKDDLSVRYNLHTLKGNIATFGLIDIAAYIHRVEDELEIKIEHISAIEDLVRSFLKAYYPILDLDYDKTELGETYVVSDPVLANLEDIVKTSGNLEEVRQNISKWTYKITLKRGIELLGPLPEYAETLAENMGKKLKVRVENGDILLNPVIVKPVIQVLSTLVRNSVDHGLELPSERGSKPETGTLKISFMETKDMWKISVIDNGRGIDLDKIVQRAIGKGFIKSSDVDHMTQRDKCRLIFLDGVSSTDSVSQISGRGVGMSAVMKSVEQRGGKVIVDTEKGVGTTIEILISKWGDQVEEGEIKQGA